MLLIKVAVTQHIVRLECMHNVIVLSVLPCTLANPNRFLTLHNSFLKFQFVLPLLKYEEIFVTRISIATAMDFRYFYRNIYIQCLERI